MDTYIAYFDETGDDGVTTASSEFFVLTSLYMSADSWKDNFDTIRKCRKELREQFGFHVSEEFHTKHLLSDKDPYRKYGWSPEQRNEITRQMIVCVQIPFFFDAVFCLDQIQIEPDIQSVILIVIHKAVGSTVVNVVIIGF